MYSKPKIAEVNGRRYIINTSFKVALKCEEIAKDFNIGDYERALAIIYLLYGEKALDYPEDQEKLLKVAQKYLSCNQEIDANQKIDMDLNKDYELILASFMTDFNIDIETKDMHWWTFYAYLKGLTDKCILNRVREIRNINLSEIKDVKERNKIAKIQKQFELNKKERIVTSEQVKNANRFLRLAGVKRK